MPPPAHPSALGRIRYSTGFAFRQLTAGLRRPPSFVILGTQRGGTSSLYRWLAEHPDVDPPTVKEIHYFDKDFAQGPRWYQAHFPFKRPGRITGEGSPYMLFHPLAPERAAAGLDPSTKFIVLLREPVDRAISHYWFMQKIGGLETESFADAVALEPERMAAVTAAVLRGEFSAAHAQFSYLSRGEYATQLRRWFDAVGRDRILVLESERLYVDPSTSQQVLDFLGLAPHDHEYPVINIAARPRRESPELLQHLHDHFAPLNDDLFALLGRELWVDR